MCTYRVQLFIFLMALKAEKECIIGVYLPSQSRSATLNKLDACIDMLIKIIKKYALTHQIIILSDFNSSLIREKRQDSILKTFVRSHRLSIPGEMGDTSTYIHHNRIWQS